MPNEIGAIVRKMESDWKSGTTQISDYVEFDINKTINKIDAYLNSKSITGEYDSLGRKKPFFNIVKASANIRYRATDIDRKNIKVKGTNAKNFILAFIASLLLQNWMRKHNFGVFLNDWGRVLSRYGSAIPKIVRKSDGLHASVVSWKRIICDAVNFDSNPKIEILELTEQELRENENYDLDMIEDLINARTSRKTTSGMNVDNKNDYVRLYEVHGRFPVSYLTSKERDEKKYADQMHIISYVESKEKKGTYDDFTLYAGREDESPYMITHLIEEEGRTLSIGAVEDLFEPQWMMNHSMKAVKDKLDLSSKIVFQTSDPSFVGQNVLTAIENGDILIHKINEPLTQLNNSAADTSQYLTFASQWKALSNEITGISESMLGNNAPAGTAWRQVEALLRQNESLFELMRENKGLYIEEMVKTRIIPALIKDLDHSEEISAVLEDNELQMIDSIYVPREVMKRVKRKMVDEMIKGNMPNGQQLMQQETQNVQGELSQLGSTRYFKPSDLDNTSWKKLLKEFDWSKIEVDVTGENVDTEALTTMNTMLQFIGRNPQGFQQLMSMPEFRTIWNKTLSLTGAVSPIEFRPSVPSPIQPQNLSQPVGQ